MQLRTFQRLKRTSIDVLPQYDSSDKTFTFGVVLMSEKCPAGCVGGWFADLLITSGFWQLFVILMALISKQPVLNAVCDLEDFVVPQRVQ